MYGRCMRAVGAVRWVDHATVGRVPMGAIAGIPAMANDNPRSHSPHIGQHSREVLAGLGMSASEIQALIDSGAVASSELSQAAE